MSARVVSPLLVLFVGLFTASPALADVEFELPQAWAQQSSLDTSAIKRANEWGDALGGRVIRKEGSASVDEFVETLAVIEFNRPVDASALESDEAAQAYLDQLMQPLVGDAQAADLARVALPTTSVVSIRGHYIVGGTRIEAVLVPDGTKTSLVMVGGLESEQILYAPIVSPLLESIDGGAAPVKPFDAEGFRTKYIVGWIFAFLAIYLGSIAAFSERKGDHKRTGGFAALITAGLAVVASIVVWIMLRGNAAGLEAVGSSAGDVAGEVFGIGAIGGLIMFGVAQLLESDSGPIQSAPVSTIVNVPGAGAPPASHAPPPSHLPQEEAAEPEAIELPDEPEPEPEPAKAKAKMPPPSSRVPPPPSSVRKRVESSKVKDGSKPAKLEDAHKDSK